MGTVRVFYAPNDVEERSCSLAELQPARLWPRALVFAAVGLNGAPSPGRIVGAARGSDSGGYEIELATGKVVTLEPDEFDVVSPDALVDPLGLLQAGAFEGPTVHDRRLAAMRSLIALRGAARGQAGLLSASVELLPHQIDVVTRILEDPVRRYLLADEVGLGKTIEAGIVLRQLLIDDRQAKAVVLVPLELVAQWTDELSRKLHVLDEFGDRVQVLPFEKLFSVDRAACDILIVDEAHQLVLAESGPQPTDGTLPHEFGCLATLAYACQSVLLLSAIPVVGNETAMLRMLHLLDPIVHRLDRPDLLQAKVLRQSEIANVMQSLDPESGMPDFILAEDTAAFAKTVPDDDVVQELARRANMPDADVKHYVRLLRDHLAETYRLHHRLVRTRRADLERQGEGSAYGFLPRAGDVAVTTDDDLALKLLADDLEEWRLLALEQLANAPDGDDLRDRLGGRFTSMLEAHGRGSPELVAELCQQWADVQQGKLPGVAGEEVTIAGMQQRVANLPKVSTRSIRRLRSSGWTDYVAPCEHRYGAGLSATTALIEALSKDGHAIQRVVVFSSSTAVARNFATLISRILGPEAVGTVIAGGSIDDVEAAVRTFRTSTSTAVLVCDQTGEHGLNLQVAQGMVHLDLPLSPTRIEQRIGRIDRFGRTVPKIRHAVVVTDGRASSWGGVWLHALTDGFGIFQRPISDVQFLLERLETELRETALAGGVHSLTQLASGLAARLEAERLDLDGQYALSRLAFGQSGGLELAQNIREVEAHEGQLERSLDDWIRNVVGLDQAHTTDDDWYQYQWSARTSLPSQTWQRWLSVPLRYRWTYRRAVSLADSRVRLVRPGAELLSRLEPLLEDHDEGRTFGLWRHVPGVVLPAGDLLFAFRLVYRVCAQVSPTAGTPMLASDLVGLQRRADRYLPPFVETIYVGRDLERITDPEILALLERPYATERDDGGRDYLISSQPEMLNDLLSRQAFVGLCDQLRERAPKLPCEVDRLRQLLARATSETDRLLRQRRLRLERRAALLLREQGETDPSIAREEAALELIAAAVKQPTIQLDAVGVILLANRAPVEQL